MIKNLLFKSATPGQRSVITLFAVIVLSSALFILINYFTIKTLTSVRAYTNGESRYSKGQKDAARHLVSFIVTSDERFWKEFETEIAVPMGDSMARVALTTNGDDRLIRDGFIQGLNHPDDLSNLIWLYRNFNNVSFMREAVSIWKSADGLVAQLNSLGHTVYPLVKSGTLSPQQRLEVITEINRLTAALTIKERAFADVLGSAARTIANYLFYTNFILTIIIISSAAYYASIIIRRLREKNRDLVHTNHELDKFVYSVSHDLRAPITSLKGLINLAREEKDMEQINRYWDLMQVSLTKQDQFIKDIISFSRNKRTEIQKKEVDLNVTVDEVLDQLRFMKGPTVAIEKNIPAVKVRTDEIRLKIILSNLISNALKYSDLQKPTQMVWIKSFLLDHFLTIEISDNGIGINKEYQSLIFDMFFVTSHSNKGTGLGLYIVKETINKLDGHIKVESIPGEGSKFTVNIPL